MSEHENEMDRNGSSQNTEDGPSLNSGDPQSLGESEQKPKGKGGRPRKVRNDDPLTPEPDPRVKKVPEEVKDTYTAIHRTYERQKALVEKHRELHPDSPCGDAVDPLAEKKDKLGAPIEKTAFHAPVIGLCRVAGWLGDLEKNEMPEQADYDRCAESWAKTSRHLGLSEKAAALFSSVSETIYVVGFTAARAVKKAFLGGTVEEKEKAAEKNAPEPGEVSLKAVSGDHEIGG